MKRKLNKQFVDCFKDPKTPKEFHENKQAYKKALDLINKTLK